MAAALSPDGRTAIISGSDRTVRAWTASEEGAKSRTLFTNPLSYVASIAFDPAGETIAMGGGLYDGGVLIWDRARDGLKHPRLGGESLVEVTALAFSPDGKQLASANADAGEVSLWDVDTGGLIGQPFHVSPADRIIQLGFIASGNQLVGLTQGGKALVWNLDPAAWTAIACAIANRDFTADEKRTILLGIAGLDTCARHR
jgi:WD40 repeat protein